MSADAQPISPARFAEAIQDLSLATLHLKVLEIRNDIAHLDYSNEQLLPYARGTAFVLGAAAAHAEPEPDQDCVDAIRENEAVIARKLEQIRLVRAEVEQRGGSWTEFQSKAEADQQAAEAQHRADRTAFVLAAAQSHLAARGDADHTAIGTNGASTNGASTNGASTNGANGANGTSTTSDPWSDGTFQTGTIRNGELHMDAPGSRPAAAAGGSLSDEQLRRAMEERLRMAEEEENDGDDGGMHL